MLCQDKYFRQYRVRLEVASRQQADEFVITALVSGAVYIILTMKIIFTSL